MASRSGGDIRMVSDSFDDAANLTRLDGFALGDGARQPAADGRDRALWPDREPDRRTLRDRGRVWHRRAFGLRRGQGAALRRAAALLGGLALAGCAQARSEAPLPAQPTVVSLNPCSDAVLAEVADPGRILALSSFSRDHSSSSMDVAVARRFRAVSGSAEEVLALRPDVVIAGSFLAPALRNALHDSGIALIELPVATDIDQSEAQVRQIARIVGEPQRGDDLVRRIERALAKAAPPAGTRPISAVVWESGGIVAGDATLVADLLRRTGFANASALRGLGQADYLPLEAIVADPPPVIFVAGNSRAREDRLLDHPALAGLTQSRRVQFDPSLLWCGGPTIARAAARLAGVRRVLREDGARASTGSARAEVAIGQSPPGLSLSKAKRRRAEHR